MDDTKLFSEAQANHYQSLMAQRDAINAEIQRFAAYLAAEHKISGDGWIIHHDRFEKDQPGEQNPAQPIFN